MSAYLSSNDTISALVTYWSDSASHRNYTTPKDSLSRAFAMAKLAQDEDRAYPHGWAEEQTMKAIAKYGSTEKAAFALLVLENIKSLISRYPGDDEMFEEASFYQFKRSAQVMRWLHYAPLGHGFLVGMVKGYSYQSCEHESWEQSAAFQLCEQIKGFLLSDLERRDCKGEKSWASFVEPITTASAPVSLSALLSA